MFTVDQYADERPRPGLPEAFARYYSIVSMLWGDYTWLENTKDLRINFNRIVTVFGFSVAQIVMAVFLEPFILVWTFLSLSALSNMFVYEAFVKDYSWD